MTQDGLSPGYNFAFNIKVKIVIHVIFFLLEIHTIPIYHFPILKELAYFTPWIMELSYKLESIQDSKIIIVVIETSYYFKCIGKQKREGEGEEGEKWKKLSSIKKNFIKLSVSPEPPIPVEYRSTEVENKISGSTDDIPCWSTIPECLADNNLDSNRMRF